MYVYIGLLIAMEIVVFGCEKLGYGRGKEEADADKEKEGNYIGEVRDAGEDGDQQS